MSRNNRFVQFRSDFDDYFVAGWAVLLKIATVALMLPVMTVMVLALVLALIVMTPVAILGWIAEKDKGNAE